MASLPLKRFGISDEQRFRERLDAATEALLDSLPVRARKWGRARKTFNIFLRNALYSHYLARLFDLDRAARHFELPLDQLTADELKKRYPTLPVWPAVAALDPEISHEYQAAAQDEGRRGGLARVHLDVYWFGAQRTGV